MIEYLGISEDRLKKLMMILLKYGVLDFKNNSPFIHIYVLPKAYDKLISLLEGLKSIVKAEFSEEKMRKLLVSYISRGNLILKHENKNKTTFCNKYRACVIPTLFKYVSFNNYFKYKKRLLKKVDPTLPQYEKRKANAVLIYNPAFSVEDFKRIRGRAVWNETSYKVARFFYIRDDEQVFISEKDAETTAHF